MHLIQTCRSLKVVDICLFHAQFSSLLMKMKVGEFLALRVAAITLCFLSCPTAWAGNPVPAIFVFGDSLVDVGNNNYLLSLARSNFLGKGVDFGPSGGRPTGRFCNGRTIVDILTEEFGIPLIPPYLAPSTTGSNILYGVNYASGGAGILNDTGRMFIERIPMDQQIDYFGNTINQLTELLGPERAKRRISEAVYSITTGSNDFLNNYIALLSRGQLRFTQEEFQSFLVGNFTRQLVRLYNLGARRFIITGVGPIGCIPYERTFRLKLPGVCASIPNELVVNFNGQLIKVIDDLNAELIGAKFIYLNGYDSVVEIINNYKAYGFEYVDKACCGIVGRYKGLLPCYPRVPYCADRSKYVFWDAYHPSDATNVLLAKKFIDGDRRYVYPINVRQLLAL